MPDQKGKTHKDKRQAPIIIATGGTGGHVFPAEALAEILVEKGHTLALVTDKRQLRFSGILEKLYRYRVEAAGVAGRGLIHKLIAICRLGLGYIQSLILILRLRPKAVIGFGGYSCVPVVLAACHLRVPTLIHEQNAVLGRANRLLAGYVRVVALSFEPTRRLPAKARSRTVLTGNPVRAEIVSLADKPYEILRDEENFRILITGGSQGAHVFADILPKAIEQLPSAVRKRLELIQQARPEDVNGLIETYRKLGVRANVSRFFTDMPLYLEESHLVIARAGATTMAELVASRRPMILVPYPHAIDDHQAMNAAHVADAALGWSIPESDFTAEWLAGQFLKFFEDPSRLVQAANAGSSVRIFDAAERLASQVEGLI